MSPSIQLNHYFLFHTAKVSNVTTNDILPSEFCIPKEVREKISVKPGQKLIIFERAGIIHLVPILPPKKLKGLLQGRGIDTVDLRDKSTRSL